MLCYIDISTYQYTDTPTYRYIDISSTIPIYRHIDISSKIHGVRSLPFPKRGLQITPLEFCLSGRSGNRDVFTLALQFEMVHFQAQGSRFQHWGPNVDWHQETSQIQGVIYNTFRARGHLVSLVGFPWFD